PVGQSAVWGTGEYVTAATSAPAWRNRNFSVPAAPPDAPANFVGTASGSDFACVGWTAPSANGSAILDYTINAYVGSSVVKSVTIGAAATGGCVPGLTVGVTYTFKALATNDVGPGPESLGTGPLLVTRGATASTSAASGARTGAQQGTSAPSPPPR